MFISKPFLAGVAVLVLAAVVFAFTLPGSPPAAADDAGIPQLKIAVVNVGEVLEKMKDRKARDEELRNEKEKLTAEIVSDRNKAVDIAEKLGKMEPGDPDREKMEQKLASLRAVVELKYKKAQARLLKRQMRDRQELYGIVRDAVNRYGRENRFSLVLKVDDRRIRDNPLTQEREIGARTVLYQGEPVTDITDAIIKMLNK